MAQAAPVIIEQVRPDGTPGRTLTLDGFSLPNEWIEAPIEFREVVSYPPGASAPVVQKIGVKYGDITLTGEWDAARLGDIAKQNVDTASIMIAEGYDVTLTRPPYFSRRCGITRFAPKWQGGIDDGYGRVEWTMVLACRSIEGVEPDPVALGIIEYGDVDALAREFAQQAAAQQAAIEAEMVARTAALRAALVHGDFRSADIVALNARYTAALEFTSRLSQVCADVSAAIQASTDPLAVSASLASMATEVAQIGREAVNGIEATTHLDLHDEASSADVTLTGWETYGELFAPYLTGAAFATRCAPMLAALSSGGSQRTPYTVVDGDTLQAIAQTRLGDWTRWQEIAALNGLSPGVALSGGTRIMLPPRTTTARQHDDVYDLDVPTWGEPVPYGLTPTGDIGLTTGLVSLRRWVIHAAFTTPGTMYDVPTFGAGLARIQSKPVSRCGPALDILVRQIKTHPRVVAAAASITAGDAPGKAIVLLNVTSTDSAEPVPVSIVVG